MAEITGMIVMAPLIFLWYFIGKVVGRNEGRRETREEMDAHYD